MAVDITIPSPGESVSEVTIGSWLKKDGDWVEQDETIVELESDKATLEVPAPAAGVLSVKAQAGDEKEVGDVIGAIDDSAEKPADGDGRDEKTDEKDDSGKTPDREAKKKQDEDERAQKERTSEPAARAEEGDEEEAAPSETARANETATKIAAASGDGQRRATSLARKIAADQGVDLADISGTGPAGRITKSDVLAASEREGQEPDRSKTVPALAEQRVSSPAETGRGVRREKMSKLRRRIAERLVQAQHQAAMLTTFNECDMSEVMRLRKRHKETFQEQHGVGLGFMSFFVKAAASALAAFPRVNAYITGEEIEYHDFIDISIAVGTDRGLVVPVLRDVQDMSFADIELTIKDFATRARDGKLTIDEMTGGTFTISNGGVYGSLNSTPILNPPQSGILGMHAIKNRPIEDADNPGQLVLRPMMNLAMSYDHRIIDGAEAVGFLVHIKDHIENPERLLLGV